MSGGFAGFDRTPDASSGRAATTTGNKRRQRVTAQVIGDELGPFGSFEAAANPSKQRTHARAAISSSNGVVD